MVMCVLKNQEDFYGTTFFMTSWYWCTGMYHTIGYVAKRHHEWYLYQVSSTSSTSSFPNISLWKETHLWPTPGPVQFIYPSGTGSQLNRPMVGLFDTINILKGTWWLRSLRSCVIYHMFRSKHLQNHLPPFHAVPQFSKGTPPRNGLKSG